MALKPHPGLPARPPRLDGSKRFGDVLVTMQPRRATLPQVPGPAELNPPAGPDVGTAKPALAPRHHAPLRQRMHMYKAVNDGIQKRLEDGAMDLPARGRRDLMALHRSIQEIEALVPHLLDGKAPPGGSEFAPLHAVSRYLMLELQARQSLRELLVDQPRHLLPMLDDMNSLGYVAADLQTVLATNRQMFQTTAPEVCGYVESLAQELKEDSRQSLREAEVQRDILGLLGSAAQGFAQERMDHHRHSAGGWLGRHHGGPKVSRAAGLLGMDVVTPQIYGLKIEGELKANFGEYFDVQTFGEKQVELSLKPGVPGCVSTQALLQELEFMNDMLGKRRDRETVKAAIKASPDLQWVRQDGQDRLALTPAALARISANGAEDATLQVAPQRRLQMRLARTADSVKLSELKAALVATFRDDLQQLEARADALCNPMARLTRAKADLIDTLMDELIASPDAPSMLARLDQAIAEHDLLWQGSWLAHDGGSTAGLLADMRAAVQRYAQDPE
ncbi:MAG TPA: hypothetical protein VFL86_16805 [Burkholderiaceae bacterium]|nr:hypothetical protein [Burkholderiaceae bacterium]